MQFATLLNKDSNPPFTETYLISGWRDWNKPTSESVKIGQFLTLEQRTPQIRDYRGGNLKASLKELNKRDYGTWTEELAIALDEKEERGVSSAL